MTAYASWPALLIPAVAAGAAVALVLTAAIQAAIIYVNRARLHVYANRFGVESEALHRTVEERNRLVAALEVTRTAAVVCVTVAALEVAIHAMGARPGTIVVAGLIIAAIVTLLQSVPRVLVKQNPERWGYALTPVARAYIVLLGWLEPIFELPARLVCRLLGISPPIAEEQQEELLRLVELEESTGGIEEEEREMIRGVIGLEDTTAREIMVPRLDIAAVSIEQTVEDAVHVIVTRGFSRIPLYEGNIDQVEGIIYAKDLLRALAGEKQPATLRDLARPAHFIPETKRVDELLKELRRARVHIAIVIDEFGGTAGLVTIEDLLEEIVGEIEDEYDLGEPTIERRGENEAVVDARVGFDVLEDLFGMEVQNAQVDTLGGLVYEKLGKIPRPGDKVQLDDLTITVLAVTGHRVKKLSLVRSTTPQADAAP